MLTSILLCVAAAVRLAIDWKSPQTVDRGDYPRMRVLADGRYALVYSQLRQAKAHGGAWALEALMRTSADRGRTWSVAETVIPPLFAKDREGREMSAWPIRN